LRFFGLVFACAALFGGPAIAGNSVYNVGGDKIILSVPDDYCILDRQSPTDVLYRNDVEKYTGPVIAVATKCETQSGLRGTNDFKAGYDFIVFKPFSSLFGWNQNKWALFAENTKDWPKSKILSTVKRSWRAVSDRPDLQPYKIEYDAAAFQVVSAHATDDKKTLAKSTLMFALKDHLFIVQGLNFKELYSPKRIEQADLEALLKVNEKLMTLTIAANPLADR